MGTPQQQRWFDLTRRVARIGRQRQEPEFQATLRAFWTARRALDVAVKARLAVLDDDDDVADLKLTRKAASDTLWTAMRLIVGAGRKPLKRQAPGRVSRSGGQRPYADKALEAALQAAMTVHRWIAQIKKDYPMSSGGFGAKGRAHDISTNAVADVAHPVTDDTFFKDVTINGGGLPGNIAKASARAPGESAGAPIVQGQTLQPAVGPNNGLVGQVEGAIKPLDTHPDHQQFSNTPVGKPRGKGQYTNMDRTNATGYAMIAGVPGWQSQRWEWLHVRGASLGGMTDGTNLVAGTRDANTHMIPFESNVRVLATAAGKSSDYRYLDVTWSLGGQHNPAAHVVDSIKLEWKLVAKPGRLVSEPEGEAEFDPLQTGSNISKDEVDALEGALKTARQNVT